MKLEKEAVSFTVSLKTQLSIRSYRNNLILNPKIVFINVNYHSKKRIRNWLIT